MDRLAHFDAAEIVNTTALPVTMGTTTLPADEIHSIYADIDTRVCGTIGDPDGLDIDLLTPPVTKGIRGPGIRLLGKARAIVATESVCAYARSNPARFNGTSVFGASREVAGAFIKHA